jgi:hypothetical protein
MYQNIDMSLCLNCVCFTIKGKDVKENKYIQIFNMWLSQLMVCGGLGSNDAIHFYTDNETLQYLTSTYSHNYIVNRLPCKFKPYIYPSPETLLDGIMTRYDFRPYEQDIYMYCDIDIFILKSLHLLTNDLQQNTIYVHSEGKLSDPNYGAAFSKDEMEKFPTNMHGFSAGKFIINGKSIHKLFFETIINLRKIIKGTFYTVEQPYFNKAVYMFLNNKICTIETELIKSPIISINGRTMNKETILLDAMGIPGDGSFHFDKLLQFYIFLHSENIANNVTSNKSKILVIMSDNRKISGEFDQNKFWSNVAYINKIYCDKFGYDFKYINPYYKENTNNINSCIDINTNELRHSSWSKIPVILNNFNKKYEYIVYIDSDCIFKNFSVSIEKTIQQNKDSSLIFLSNYPYHPELPCAGFFICKNTPENLIFLNKWYTYEMPTYNSVEWQNTLKMSKKTCSYDWIPGTHWEQDALWCLIANGKCKVTVDTSEVALIEKEGQYIRHVCSVESKNRNDYFKIIVDEIQKTKFLSYNSIIQSIQQECVDTSVIFNTFDTRNEMLKYYCSKLISPKILEIGVFKGEFLDYLVKNCNFGSIDAVDLFEGITCSGNVDGNNVVHYDVGKSYLELLDKYKADANIRVHKSNSIHFLKNQENDSYDIIYIDGDHSYNGVKNDLTNAYNKIRNKGYIMGHDYEMNMKKAKNIYNFGVKQAVDEFCISYNQTIQAKALDGCVSYCIHIKK